MDLEKAKENHRAKKSPQIIATLTASLGGFSLGTATTWTSPAFLSIDETQCLPDNCDITGVSEEEASWIAAIFGLCAAIGGPAAGYLIGRYGRKWMLMWNAVPMALGFAAFLLAGIIDDHVLIYIGRSLTGFSAGGYLFMCSIYVTEICEVSIRGSIANLSNFIITSGQAFVNLLSINGTISWQIISAVCIVPSAVMFLLMSFMPESPMYLMQQGMEEKAEKSLQRLRGKHFDITDELKQMQIECDKRKDVGSVSFKEMLTKPLYYKPFVTILILMVFQQCAAINIVLYYSQEIFSDAGSDMDPGLSAFLVTFVKAIGSGSSIYLVEKLGRKMCLIMSELLVGTSLLSLGTYFYMQDNSCLSKDYEDKECFDHLMKFSVSTVESISWLPLISLMVFMTSFAIGLGPLPNTLNAEIYPAESKTLSSSAAFGFSWLGGFAVTLLKPPMDHALGVYGTYYFYACACALGAIFVAVFVPETRGKKPEEIRKLFVREEK